MPTTARAALAVLLLVGAAGCTGPLGDREVPRVAAPSRPPTSFGPSPSPTVPSGLDAPTSRCAGLDPALVEQLVPDPVPDEPQEFRTASSVGVGCGWTTRTRTTPGPRGDLQVLTTRFDVFAGETAEEQAVRGYRAKQTLCTGPLPSPVGESSCVRRGSGVARLEGARAYAVAGDLLHEVASDGLGTGDEQDLVDAVNELLRQAVAGR